MIKKEEVKKVAELARLELSDKEIEGYQKDLSAILDYIEILKKVNVSGVEPTSHPNEPVNVMREDVSRGRAKDDRLIDLAPDKKERYVKVKAVFK